MISDAVNAMRQDDAMARNKFQQYSKDFLMCGRYNVETSDKVIDRVNFIVAKHSWNLYLRLLRLRWSMIC